MWYEALPVMILITGFLYGPQVAAYYYNKAVFGNPFRRELIQDYQLAHFNRDTRIDGAPWKVRGLENIPDV